MGYILFICGVQHLLRAVQSPLLPSSAVPENPQWGEGNREGENTWVSGHLLGVHAVISGDGGSAQQDLVLPGQWCVCVHARVHICMCVYMYTHVWFIYSFLQQLPLKNNLVV